MMHAEHPRLFFIGLFQPLGCIWPAAELQARLAARLITGVWKPPKDLRAAIDKELAHPDVRQLDTRATPSPSTIRRSGAGSSPRSRESADERTR